MCVHQAEGQDNDPIGLQGDKDTVHPVDEIIVVFKDGINGIPVGTEVPTILDGYVLAFDERGVEPEIRNDLPEQFPSYLHLRIQRRLWLLDHKDKRKCPHLQPKNHGAC
jgi:hypothetical protein